MTVRDEIVLAQDTDSWRARVNKAMYFWVGFIRDRECLDQLRDN
jgi:hypothetical protein